MAGTLLNVKGAASQGALVGARWGPLGPPVLDRDLVTPCIFSCCGHLTGDINAILGD